MEAKTLDVKNYSVKIIKKKQKPIKFIIGILSYALFIWLLLVGLTLLLYLGDIKLRASRGDYSPAKFNAYVVLTGSMLPDIVPGDVVVTKGYEPEELEVGDIITFLSSDSRFYGETITHRIVEIFVDPTTGEYSYRTKGDNNNTEDMALAYNKDILGKVILKIPKIGYVQDFLISKSGWIIAILIPCLGILAYDIMKLLKIVGVKSKAKLIKK